MEKKRCKTKRRQPVKAGQKVKNLVARKSINELTVQENKRNNNQQRQPFCNRLIVNANGGLVMGAADSLRMTAQEYTTSGTLTPWGYAKINSTAAISLTLPAGSTSEHRFLVIGQVSTGTTSATVTCSGCNLSTGALTTGVSAVFNAQYEALILYNPVSTNWHVIANVGGITIS